MRHFIAILILMVAESGSFSQNVVHYGVSPSSGSLANRGPSGRPSVDAQNTGKRPFTFEDMMALKRIGGPQVSPDGKWVLFSAVHVDLQANKKIPHLWLVPVAGGEAQQLTSDAAGEDRGRWSPDGPQIIFTSSRDGSSQVCMPGFDSGSGAVAKPQKITSISTEADGTIW